MNTIKLFPVKLFLTFAIIIFLFGCTQTTTQQFSFDTPFQIKEGITYERDINWTIKVISFTDSRCPLGANCIWQGELGVNLQTNDSNIYLGEITKNSTITIVKGNPLKFTLNSIQPNQATITVNIIPTE